MIDQDKKQQSNNIHMAITRERMVLEREEERSNVLKEREEERSYVLTEL
jgi:hypothetical protein